VNYVIIFFAKNVKTILKIVIYVIIIFANIVAQNAFVEIFIAIPVLLNAKNVVEEFVIIVQQNVSAI
jgi:hypothetical protein